jgi:hypothetical protein
MHGFRSGLLASEKGRQRLSILSVERKLEELGGRSSRCGTDDSLWGDIDRNYADWICRRLPPPCALLCEVLASIRNSSACFFHFLSISSKHDLNAITIG